MRKEERATEERKSLTMTRSRTGALLLRTRSGRIRRPRSTAPHAQTKSSSEDYRHPLPPWGIPTNGETIPTIKDLRTHRVFSSAPPCCPHDLKSQDGEKDDDVSHLKIADHVDIREDAHSSPMPSSPQENSSDIKAVREKEEDFESQDKGDYDIMVVATDVTSPPDGVRDPNNSIFAEEGHHEEDTCAPPLSHQEEVPSPSDFPPVEIESVSASAQHTADYAGAPSPPHPVTKYDATDADISSADQICTTPVLIPCSRLKVFSNPTSHCYRRLLPFLMDITKNNSSKLKIISTRNPIQRTEIDPTKKPSVQASISQDDSFPRQLETIPIQDTQMNEVVWKDSGNNTISKDNANDAQQLVLAEDCPTVFSGSELCKSESLPTPTAHNALTIDDLANSNLKHLLGKNSLSKLDHVGHGTTSVKSILKRPRGGCRGLCTCLDCTSFRLHAERALQFSNKQMHETESIASALMKELSDLRKLVANSVVPLVGQEGYGILPFSQVQVEDTCRRALDAELVARNRIREMESNLNVHCRIVRRMHLKVTFADCKESESMNR